MPDVTVTASSSTIVLDASAAGAMTISVTNGGPAPERLVLGAFPSAAGAARLVSSS